MLFVDSADKAARFIWCCDAFNIPLVFLADVPGFMIGTEVERQGIIRHGAKMITAVSEATVPKVSVIVRKAYGAGLYAMSGPAFEPEATIALPTAKIAVMGPEAAVNAVFANKIAAIEDPDERDGLRRRAAPDLRGGRRPAPPRLRAGDRRRRRLRRPARRDRPPPGTGPGQGPPLLRPPPRRAAGLTSPVPSRRGLALRSLEPREWWPMPWCDDCQKFWNPNSMPENGECPTCQRVISLPQNKTPWHFKLLVVAISLYLGFRLLQGIVWVAHQF